MPHETRDLRLETSKQAIFDKPGPTMFFIFFQTFVLEHVELILICSRGYKTQGLNIRVIAES